MTKAHFFTLIRDEPNFVTDYGWAVLIFFEILGTPYLILNSTDKSVSEYLVVSGISGVLICDYCSRKAFKINNQGLTLHPKKTC